jgi:hypothetical protein
MGDRNQGKARQLPTAADLAADFTGCLEREGFQILAISGEHAVRAGLLPGAHTASQPWHSNSEYSRQALAHRFPDSELPPNNIIESVLDWIRQLFGSELLLG